MTINALRLKRIRIFRSYGWLRSSGYDALKGIISGDWHRWNVYDDHKMDI